MLCAASALFPCLRVVTHISYSTWVVLRASVLLSQHRSLRQRTVLLFVSQPPRQMLARLFFVVIARIFCYVHHDTMNGCRFVFLVD